MIPMRGAGRDTQMIFELHRHSKKTIVDLYCRVCEDSGHKMDSVQAAILVGKVLTILPLEVLGAVGSMQEMKKIAKGK